VKLTNQGQMLLRNLKMQKQQGQMDPSEEVAHNILDRAVTNEQEDQDSLVSALETDSLDQESLNEIVDTLQRGGHLEDDDPDITLDPNQNLSRITDANGYLKPGDANATRITSCQQCGKSTNVGEMVQSWTFCSDCRQQNWDESLEGSSMAEGSITLPKGSIIDTEQFQDMPQGSASL